MDDIYDPSFFVEREAFINTCKDFVVDSSFKDEFWREFCAALVDGYENLIEVYRNYVDCYDEEEKEVLEKRYFDISSVLHEAMDAIQKIKCTQQKS